MDRALFAFCAVPYLRETMGVKGKGMVKVVFASGTSASEVVRYNELHPCCILRCFKSTRQAFFSLSPDRLSSQEAAIPGIVPRRFRPWWPAGD